MSITLFDASAPRFIYMLNNFAGILEKAHTQAVAKKFDEAFLINDRLYPDMFAFNRQVYITTDTAKGAMARLAGVDIPVYDDVEKTFADLKTRVTKTVAFIETFTPEHINGQENREIIIKRGETQARYTGMQFLLAHAIPNFYFHMSTAYNLLRSNGIEIGKRDFLGRPEST